MADAPSPTIQCPSCRKEIRLTESLAAPLVESARAEFAQRALEQEQAIAAREDALKAQRAAVEAARASLDEQVAEKLRAERAILVASAQQKARAEMGDELAQIKAEKQAQAELLSQRDAKLAEARGKEVELLKQQRALEDQQKELALTVERTLSEERGKLRDEARRAADEDNHKRMAEKEKTILDMQQKIVELQRRAEQGSQQLQGEVLELELENLLRTTFPVDTILPVPKGEHGGDVLHRVLTPSGEVAGTMLWESKRTKNYDAKWLPKLRNDQRAAKAEIAILVSDALPDGIDGFGQRDGVWVTSPRGAMAVGLCLRQLVVGVAQAHKAGEGREAKMEMVYQYLMGPRFRQRIEAIVEAFDTMRKDLHTEQKVITKQWAKREEQIARALRASTGMYGDLQGIAGKSLEELPGLDFAALEAPRTLEASDDQGEP